MCGLSGGRRDKAGGEGPVELAKRLRKAEQAEPEAAAPDVAF